MESKSTNSVFSVVKLQQPETYFDYFDPYYKYSY
jgi:hypothetical protein